MIGLFSEKKKKNQRLTVVSPGTQQRNFTHVNDVVSGLLLVAENGYGDEYGIGAKESYTIIEIANMFRSEIEMLPERRGNRLIADVLVEKTKKLGWKQKHKLMDYINDILDEL